MTTTTLIQEKKDKQTEECIEKDETFCETDIDESIIQKQQEETFKESGLSEKLKLPEIRGLEFLKEGIYSVDIERTISRMLESINSMEKQLESVLSLNIHLKKELEDSKEIIAELKNEKLLLEDTIARMELEIPSKRELQSDIELIIAERNNAQNAIFNQKFEIDKLLNEVSLYQKRIISLEQDKRDAMLETDYMESKINAINAKYRKIEKEVNVLRGERLTHVEKIMSLETELNKSLEEKYRLFKDLNDATTEIKKLTKKSKTSI